MLTEKQAEYFLKISDSINERFPIKVSQAQIADEIDKSQPFVSKLLNIYRGLELVDEDLSKLSLTKKGHSFSVKLKDKE